MKQRTTLFLSHGGGPLPLLGDPGHRAMVETIATIRHEIPMPSAILVVSAHWEESVPTVTSGTNPPLIYDYGGFPPESYRLTYPSPGDPELAARIVQALQKRSVPVAASESRGWDHGVFVPLKLLFPDADIPVVELSLDHSLDPELHIRIGEALRDLPDENLLIVGSGFTFHNMRAFYGAVTVEEDRLNKQFEQWVQETMSDRDLSEEDRRGRLVDWEAAPGARYAHPREEHLLPLHVCYGVEKRPSDTVFSVPILGRDSSFFLWKS